MKFKTTQKAVKDWYVSVIAIPYCNFDSLLALENPVAYTTRREGWGADIYEVNDVAIATGYAPFGNIRVPYEKQREYEEKARKIRYGSKPWKEMAIELRNLLETFVSEVTA